MLFVWLLFALVMLALEVVTTAFFAVFVALGGLAAMAVAAASDNVWGQLAVFALVSLGGTVLARPILVKRLQSRSPMPLLRGVQDLEGQTGVVADQVGDEHHPGHVNIGGERWLAASEDGSVLVPDTRVVVVGVRGTTLVVRPADPKPSDRPPSSPPRAVAP